LRFPLREDDISGLIPPRIKIRGILKTVMKIKEIFSKIKTKISLKSRSLTPRKTKILRLSLMFLIGLAILFVLKSLFVAALVNGVPVSRISVIKELENQGGQKILDSLIEKKLIFQEAKRQGVKIGQEVIDSEITRIEGLLKEQGMTLEQALEARAESKEQLIEEIRLQKTVEAILSQKINVSEDDLKKYFEDNKDQLGTDAKFETLKDQIKGQLFQQKLSEEYSKWIEELKGKAKILYLVKF